MLSPVLRRFTLQFSASMRRLFAISLGLTTTLATFAAPASASRKTATRKAQPASVSDPKKPGAKAPAKKAAVEYVVQKGDSCVGIARRELGDPKRYKELHVLNPILQVPQPHKLVPGTVLLLPAPKDDRPDAEVTSVQREVEARPGGQGTWQPAHPGLPVFRGWRVNTHDRSFADLRFADTSTLSMDEKTLVIIFGTPTSTRAQSLISRAKLSRGTLRARLGEFQNRPSSLELETPSAKADFRGGEGLIDVREDGHSRIENHGQGNATVQDSAGKKKVRLKKATGTKVAPGQTPLPPRPLPATPTWKVKPSSAIALNGREVTVHLAWNPVPEAAAYRIELKQLKPPQPAATIWIATLKDKQNQLRLGGLPPGHYAISVASIDNEDFTSLATKPLAFQVRQAQLLDGQGPPPGRLDPQKTPKTPEIRPLPLEKAKSGANKAAPKGAKATPKTTPEITQVPVGARWIAPPEARFCMSPTLAINDPRGLRPAGRHTISCGFGSNSQSEVISRNIELVQIPLQRGKDSQPLSSLIISSSARGPQAPGQAQEQLFWIADPAHFPYLHLEPSAGLEILDLKHEQVAKRTRVTFKTRHRGSPRSGEITVFAGPTPAQRIAIAVLPWFAPEPALREHQVPTPHLADPSHFEVGFGAGLWLPSPVLSFSASNQESAVHPAKKASQVAIAFAFFPDHRLSIAFEQHIGAAASSNGRSLQYLSAQLHLQAQNDRWRISPVVGLAAGAIAMAPYRGDRRIAFSGFLAPSLGLRLRLNDRWRAHLSWEHRIGPNRHQVSKTSHSPLLSVGLRYRLQKQARTQDRRPRRKFKR